MGERSDWVLTDELNGEFTNDNNIVYDEYQQFFLGENGYQVIMLVDFLRGLRGPILCLPLWERTILRCMMKFTIL